MLAKEGCLECVSRKAGELTREESRGDVDRRDSNLLSNGRRGVIGPLRGPRERADCASVELWQYQSMLTGGDGGEYLNGGYVV